VSPWWEEVGAVLSPLLEAEEGGVEGKKKEEA